MLFRLSPLSLEGSLILNEVNFLCGWMKTPHVALSGLCGGLFPLLLLTWSLLMASWPWSNVAKGSNVVPGEYGPALLLPRGDVPVPAGLRAGETSQIFSRAGDEEQLFGGHPSSASSFCPQCQHPMGCFTA